MPDQPVRMSVNGNEVEATVEPRMTLADFLRERCGLTGTHLGCEHGSCGACTVLADGQAVRACLMFAVQAEGLAITTVEGIATGEGELSAVQSALRVRAPGQLGRRVSVCVCDSGASMWMRAAFCVCRPSCVAAVCCRARASSIQSCLLARGAATLRCMGR